MKLKKAAQITAWRGDNTWVETIVEMELAASCMPFVKSKARATIIIKIIYTKFKSTFINQQILDRFMSDGNNFTIYRIG